MKYLIIDTQYRVYKSSILSGKIRRLAKDGKLSIIDIRHELGINRCDSEEGAKEEWSQVQELPANFEPEPNIFVCDECTKKVEIEWSEMQQTPDYKFELKHGKQLEDMI